MEGTDVDAAAGADIPSPEQCLGCDSLMDQLRDTSNEVHQLRVRLAEATEALQVTPRLPVACKPLRHCLALRRPRVHRRTASGPMKSRSDLLQVSTCQSAEVEAL